MHAPGALKSGFTRTGKRTLGGLVDDGVKSCVRYYLNNFHVRGSRRWAGANELVPALVGGTLGVLTADGPQLLCQ